MGRVIPAALIAFFALAMLGLGGCGDAQDRVVDSAIELPVQDRIHMVLPLDDYYVREGYFNYVVYVHADDCLVAKGFDRSKAVYDPSPRSTVTISGVPIFNPSVAADFGYGQEVNHLTYVDWSPTEIPGPNEPSGYEQEQVACRIAAEKFYDITMDLSGPAFGATEQSATDQAELTRLSRDWVSCMAPLGIADLPDSPETMPPESVSATLGKYDANDTYLPSASELRVAVADADCRESTGWAEAAYQAAWNSDVLFIKTHGDEPAARKAEIVGIEKKFSDYLANRG